jgi:hypothetical protein
MLTSRRNFLALAGSSAALLAAPLAIRAAEPHPLAGYKRCPIQRFRFAYARAILEVRGVFVRATTLADESDHDLNMGWHNLALDPEMWETLPDGLVDAKRLDILRWGNPLAEEFQHLPSSFLTSEKQEPEDKWYAVATSDGYRINRPDAAPNSGEIEVDWFTYMHEAVAHRIAHSMSEADWMDSINSCLGRA